MDGRRQARRKEGRREKFQVINVTSHIRGFLGKYLMLFFQVLH